MPIPDRELTPVISTEPINPESTEQQTKLTQDQATEIFNEILDEVKKGLGSWVDGYLLLEHNVERDGIMVLIDKAVQIITALRGHVTLLNENYDGYDKNISFEILNNSKSKIAACVAFLCYICDSNKVGNKEVVDAVKRNLISNRSLKSGIKEIIEFVEGKGYNDPNIARIEIDDSYKVTIEIVGGSSIEYTLDW